MMIHELIHEYVKRGLKAELLQPGDHIQIFILSKDEYQLVDGENLPTNYVIED